MKHLTLAVLITSCFVPGLAGATDPSTIVPLTQMVAGHAKDAPSPAAPAPAACTEAVEFLTTNCTLARYGITLYGTIDMGVTWQSHGTPFNSSFVAGKEYLLQKNSNRSGFDRAPNGLSQSVIGIRGSEAIAHDWDFVFTLEGGFNPYSLHLADGPGSIAQNKGVPLTRQSSNADSSRAGQFYNSQGYFGVSSPTYGALTIFRQNALTLDAVAAYDPLGGSYAFSPIGYQGIACGGGNTENCRFTTALKYRVNVGQLRGAALWEFGGYGLNNGSRGAYQLQIGTDILDVAGGTVSLDGIYSYVKDSVAVGLAGNTLPEVLPQVLTATLSDNTAWMALAKYSNGPAKFFGGYERVEYAPPSTPSTAFTDIAGDFLCVGCASRNNTNISNTAFSANHKVLQIFWVGGRYALRDDLTLMAGYYEYLQNSFGTGASCANAAKATCSGMYNAFSIAVDWQFAAKFDAYAGLMYQTVNAGLANGFLHRNAINPTVGLRFRF